MMFGLSDAWTEKQKHSAAVAREMRRLMKSMAVSNDGRHFVLACKKRHRSCLRPTCFVGRAFFELNRLAGSKTCITFVKKWLGTDSNRRHVNFQSTALPTELPSRVPVGCALWTGGFDAQDVFASARDVATLAHEVIERQPGKPVRLNRKEL